PAWASSAVGRGCLAPSAPAPGPRAGAGCRPGDNNPAVITARRRCLADRARQLVQQLDRFARATPRTLQQAVDGAWAMAEPTCDDARALVFGPYGEVPPFADLAARLDTAPELMRVRPAPAAGCL